MNAAIRIALVLVSAVAACSPLAALAELGVSHGLLRVLGIRNNVTMRLLTSLVTLVILWFATMVTITPPAKDRPDGSEELSRIERELDRWSGISF